MGRAMTERLFLDDAQLRDTEATVIASGPQGIVLDRTVFYARSGGQPGDSGVLGWAGGEARIGEAIKGDGETVLHPVAEGGSPAPGTPGAGRDRLGPAIPADAHAHGAPSALQRAARRGGHRRTDRG